MPALPRQLIVWWKNIKLLGKPGIIKPQPVYAAVCLLLIAGTLLFTVFTGLQETVKTPIGGETAELIGKPAPAVTQQQLPGNQPESLLPDTAATAVTQPQEPELAQWPLKGEIVTGFGWNMHPVYKDWRYHTGLDINGTEGQTVNACLSGEVEEIYNDQTSGLTVVVKSDRYSFYYGSMKTISVKKHSHIGRGTVVGTVGRAAAEPYSHLHLAVKRGDKYIDPREIVK